MKKLLIVALLAASLTGFAQKKTGADKMLDKMTTELSLTADQQAKLKPLFEEQFALKADTKANADHEEDNKVKNKELGKKIGMILTAEQKDLRKQLQEKEKAAKEAGQ
ncbi:hypothetical protein FFWV33_00445 [Flavobacterium faecale]|uniref:DUF4890 domain-containing protein n=1 Tax=Flavobacterium faecale TaxID=1355330 RepID=A0A2S1L8N9_9FLAO|nr:hypothetical protein [Flavobacterium faecale]AWG20093.1 hypothetical protein FFWV33_00445 [Flavobacterium faecale]